jgi:hypothetical protein
MLAHELHFLLPESPARVLGVLRDPKGGAYNSKESFMLAHEMYFLTSRISCKQACVDSESKKSPGLARGFFVVAERGGFEPPVRLPVHMFSKHAV